MQKGDLNVHVFHYKKCAAQNLIDDIFSNFDCQGILP